ncbi:MAG: hypothetical protein BECKG1743F_GA0114225_108465 [Candidatus Kentron sp. G]|nr:MAG: hypothetical protein BECKG1743F_GA0114225_108465 [Candidatus Kentron sp. G]VFN05794.1 MAG: hypothetical protein BECKG1743E_GA0114224_109183 [Candidatus Kentron sp. G]
MRKKLLDTFGAQVSSDHERYPADVKCLGFLYLYVGRYPRNNASRNSLSYHLRHARLWWSFEPARLPEEGYRLLLRRARGNRTIIPCGSASFMA